VLQEQQYAVKLALDDAGMKLPLQVEAGGVPDRAEPPRRASLGDCTGWASGADCAIRFQRGRSMK
jgi:hypothetical protein